MIEKVEDITTINDDDFIFGNETPEVQKNSNNSQKNVNIIL